MDIGLNDYITARQGLNDSVAGLSAQIQTVAAGYAAGWGNDKAIALANLLNQVPSGTNRNQDNQNAAVRDPLSLFAVSQKASGSRDAVKTHIQNGDAGQKETVVKALFGNGDAGQGLAASLHVGADKKNTYPFMRDVVSELGISRPTNVVTHENHFHLYLRPPQVQPIVKISALLADSPPLQGVYSQTVGSQPAKELKRYDYVLSACDRTDFSAAVPGIIDPATKVAQYFEVRLKQAGLSLPDAKITVLQAFKHGNLVPLREQERVLPEGRYYDSSIFRYVPRNMDDFLNRQGGIDHAILEVEAMGKRVKLLYKILGGYDFVTEDPTEAHELDKACPANIRRIGVVEGTSTFSVSLDGQPGYLA